MVVEYKQVDGSIKVCGYMMPDGPIWSATGQMVRGWHSKCYWIAKKREARGDAVTGRVVAGSPTGYDIDQLVLSREDFAALGITQDEARERSTVQLSRRLARLREVAATVGKGVGDPTVHEAFAADEHGGPYTHQHHHRLDDYQLVAHLHYAHGLAEIKFTGDRRNVQDQHAELHARQNLNTIQQDRSADNEGEPVTRDWRQQFTAELGQETP